MKIIFKIKFRVTYTEKPFPYFYNSMKFYEEDYLPCAQPPTWRTKGLSLARDLSLDQSNGLKPSQ